MYIQSIDMAGQPVPVRYCYQGNLLKFLGIGLSDGEIKPSINLTCVIKRIEGEDMLTAFMWENLKN